MVLSQGQGLVLRTSVHLYGKLRIGKETGEEVPLIARVRNLTKNGNLGEF